MHPFEDQPQKSQSRQSVVRYDALTSDVGNGGLAYEGEGARLLTLRNTHGGYVLRQTAMFDVIAVTRETDGFCADADCDTTFAVDVMSGSEVEENCTHHFYPIASFRSPGFDSPQPVPALDECLLSLGRAAMTDPRWLLRDPAWRSHMAGQVFVLLNVKPSTQLSETRPDRLREWTGWSLTENPIFGELPSPWLPAIAYVFCQPPASSFVRLPEWLLWQY